ncbi:MAG TPA: hypothetical protein P5186_19890 [Candidatus Paceibacterota bacterium]|nr:hypothetical protein [Verrucomicrobiota bacterium]HRY50321.1 hypothetical protein [Candidatus Paceibacterota bacterium]
MSDVLTMAFSEKRRLLWDSVALPAEEDWGAELWAKLMENLPVLCAINDSLISHLEFIKQDGKFECMRIGILSLKIYSSICYHFPKIGFNREDVYRVLAHFFSLNLDPRLYHDLMTFFDVAWTRSMKDVQTLRYGPHSN